MIVYKNSYNYDALMSNVLDYFRLFASVGHFSLAPEKSKRFVPQEVKIFADSNFFFSSRGRKKDRWMQKLKTRIELKKIDSNIFCSFLSPLFV